MNQALAKRQIRTPDNVVDLDTYRARRELAESRLPLGKYLAMGGVIIALAGGLYEGAKHLIHVPTPQQQTAYPVPKANQPHHTLRVHFGDTESSIAAKEGHADDLSYENMLNNQLPSADQASRTLRPGEVLTVPGAK